MRTISLDALKDYLELARNFVFGNGLVVIAGAVVRDERAIGYLASRCIVWSLVCASFAYIAAAIFYVDRRHRPLSPTRRQKIIGVTRTALLFVLMETSLIMVGNHVDAGNRALRNATFSIDQTLPAGEVPQIAKGGAHG